jgi:hypothetical protein
MKATLSFNLPEESLEHHDALHGHEWKSIVHSLHRELRNARKHGHNYKSADEALEDFFNAVTYEVLDRGLTLD